MTEEKFRVLFSFSEVSKKIADICSYPSFFAALAKKLYRVRACDSPVNAAQEIFFRLAAFQFHGASLLTGQVRPVRIIRDDPEITEYCAGEFITLRFPG
jgi:hypothetical protein